MTTPSEPDYPSAPSPPLDPVVSELARRIKASSLPEARALVPLSAEQRRALTDKLLGTDEDARPAPAPPVLHVVPSPEVTRPRARRWWPAAVAAALCVLLPALLWLRGAPVAECSQCDIAGPSDTPPRPEAPLRLGPSTTLAMVLSPPESGPDATVRMLVVRGGQARLVWPAYEIDGRGQLRIDEPARDALGDQEDGPAELVWLVGREMPDDDLLEQIAVDPGLYPPPGAGSTVRRRAVVFESWGVPADGGGGRPAPSGTAATPAGSAVATHPPADVHPGTPTGLVTEEAKRRGLEAKVFSGHGSIDDIRMLKAICSHLGDRDCRDRANALLKQRLDPMLN